VFTPQSAEVFRSTESDSRVLADTYKIVALVYIPYFCQFEPILSENFYVGSCKIRRRRYISVIQFNEKVVKAGKNKAGKKVKAGQYIIREIFNSPNILKYILRDCCIMIMDGSAFYFFTS